MPILVSCWHCKRAVLMVPRMTERELVRLWDHLGGCDPDDPSIGLSVEMEGGMNDDDLDGGRRGPLWRLVGAAISVMLVSEYIILGTTTLALRALRGVAAEAWRRLLPPRDRPRDAATPGAEAA